MKKLKTILQSKKLLCIFMFACFLYVLCFINFIKIDKCNKNEIIGNIIQKNIDGNMLSLIVKNKGKTLVNYYFKSEKEKNSNKLLLGDKIIGNVQNIESNNYKKYLYSKKIFTMFSANTIKLIKKNNNVFYEIKNLIEKRINKCMKTKSYIKTFILGDKNDIDIKRKYQNLGVSHLFSVSGMHVTLLTGILLFALKKVKFKSIIVSIFLLFYLFLTDFSPSILRASLMFIIYIINKNLNINSVYLLLYLCFILLIINPFYIYDVGFIFSFVISFYLLYFKNNIKKYKNYISKLIYISFISFMASLPIVINSFNQVNILSIIYNLFYVPFISFIIFPLGLITFIFPVLDSFYNLLINALSFVTNFLSSINSIVYFAEIPIVFILMYYLFLTFKNKKMKYILLTISIIFFYYYNSFTLNTKVSFIDVNQGDSSIIRIKNKNILIDTGGKQKYKVKSWKKQNKDNSIFNYKLFPYLKAEGIKKIDYLILTHGDFDHMGEAINLVNNFKVEKVIFNCGPYNNLEKELIKVLDKKKIKYYLCIKELNIDKNKLYFLQTKVYDNENDNSNVIYTELNGYKFMFMGDASVTTEKEILDKYNISDIDVLKVGHHGSKTSSSKEFINEINPKYSIISVGKNNRYGHPNKETLENLKESIIYRTDQDGSIMFKIKKNKLKIEICSP